MSARTTIRVKEHLFGKEKVKNLLPGFIISVVLMVIAQILSIILNLVTRFKVDPFNPILITVILGIIFRNSFLYSEQFKPGVEFGIKKLLRFGIILMGIRLSFLNFVRIGFTAAGMVIITISSVILITMLVSEKINISKKLALLIAAGTSICGISAVIATAPVIEADEEEVSYSIATITIFGIMATLIYPYFIEIVLNLNAAQAGFFIGTAVHDTSQVTATALIYEQLWGGITAGILTSTDIAITTKLVRNTMMLIVIPLMSVLARKNSGTHDSTKSNILKFIPLFVLGYILMGVLRSVGDYSFGVSNSDWINTWETMTDIATYIIAISITCVGLNTNLKKLVKLNIKPLIVGFIAAFCAGIVSYILIIIFAGRLI